MTSRLVLTKKDPRRTDFVLLDDALHNNHATPAAAATAGQSVYTSDTTHYARPRNGARATTLITRTDPGDGDRLQVGIIEWPLHPLDPAQLVVGTRDVHMAKSGIFTSSERFTATDGCMYEWQIHDARPQLVPVRPGHNRTSSSSYVATFVQSHSGFCLRRKHTAALFIPPEGYHILDDIVVTFIYFESRWRDKEGVRSRSSISGSII